MEKFLSRIAILRGNKKILTWGIIIGVVLILFVAYRIIYNANSKPDVAASTSENCDLVHNIYSKEEHAPTYCDWDEYRNGTLYNLGLCYDQDEKKWNGTWLIDEDFISEYIEKYGVEEFLGAYEKYIAGFIEPASWTSASAYYSGEDDASFAKNNGDLLTHISNTTEMLFNMPDVFDVVGYSPSTDAVIDEVSDENSVSGEFNEGSDNHVVTRSSTLTTDTFTYDGYVVEHIYGKRYEEGELGWRNGKFIDEPSKFIPVDTWRLYVGDNCILGPANSLEGLDCRWIACGDKKYYERTLKGIGSDVSIDYSFSSSVNYLTTNRDDAVELYIDY